MLADYGDGKKDLQKALTLAKQVSARFPNNPIIMDTLGWVYYRQGDFRKAAEILEKSAVKFINNPLFRYHTGMALYRSGRNERAKAHLRFAATSKIPFAGKEEAIEILRRN
jgi:predicted Zn-dependent protease